MNVALAKTQAEFKNFRGLLKSMEGQILAALPKHIPATSYIRSALTLVQRNPKLLECDQYSVLGALMESAQRGLVLGHEAHLVPFRNKSRNTMEVQLIFDYKGLIKLMTNSGAVIGIKADVVRIGDDFVEHFDGIHHKKNYSFGEPQKVGGVSYVAPRDLAPIWAVYAEARMRDGTRQWRVLTMDEIEAARNASKSGDYGPWSTHFVEMAKKTAIRRLAKYLPQSSEMMRAMELEDLNLEGRSQGLRGLVDETYEPQYESGDATTVEQINSEGKAKVDENKRAVLLKCVRDAWNGSISLGVKEAELLKALGIQHIGDLESESIEQLDAALDILQELNPSVNAKTALKDKLKS